MRLKTTALVLILALLPIGLPGQSANPSVTIKVDAAHPGAAISPADVRHFLRRHQLRRRRRTLSRTRQEPLLRIHRAPHRMARGPRASAAKVSITPKGELDIRTEDPLNATQPPLPPRHALSTRLRLLQRRLPRNRHPRGAEYRFSAYVRTRRSPKSLRAIVNDEKRTRQSPPESSKASTTTGRNTKPSSAPTPPADNAQLDSLPR